MNTKMSKTIIYTNNTCNYCKQVKEELTKNNIDFENKVTNENIDEWNKVTNFLGVSNVPVILQNDSYLVPARDFNSPEHLINILNGGHKRQIPDNKTINECILENLRTLNFNIAGAFRNLDQILKKIEQDVNKSTD